MVRDTERAPSLSFPTYVRQESPMHVTLKSKPDIFFHLWMNGFVIFLYLVLPLKGSTASKYSAQIMTIESPHHFVGFHEALNYRFRVQPKAL